MARATGIPVGRVDAVGAADRAQLLALEELLARRVVGQDAAVEAVADAVRAGRSGLAAPGRPLGSLLFVGPTGVGKTELARALADALHGTEPVRFDMAEFADASSLTRLLGAPPGHVGHDEPGQLTEALRRDPYAVLLFDEVEKAHREVTGALLSLLDAGRLTDAHGRAADATHAVVILTSNLGADLILGSAAGAEAVRGPVLTLARAVLRPELVNRVDEVVLFDALGPAALATITGMALAETRARLAAQGMGLVVSDAALAWLAGRVDRGPELGARPLRRTVGARGRAAAVADAARRRGGGGRGGARRRRARGRGGRRRPGGRVDVHGAGPGRRRWARLSGRARRTGTATRPTRHRARRPTPAGSAGQPRVRRHRGRQLVTRTVARAWDDNIFSESAAAAFWQTLSLPPLLLGLFGVLSYVGDLYGPDTVTAVQEQVVDLVGHGVQPGGGRRTSSPRPSRTSSRRRGRRSSRSGS